MKLYRGLALAGAAATAMALMSPPLEAQSPSERTRAASIKSQAGPARRGSAFDAIGIHGFSIVLVIGDMQGVTAGNDTVPGAANRIIRIR